jgi:hypothetical protein
MKLQDPILLVNLYKKLSVKELTASFVFPRYLLESPGQYLIL